MGVQFTLIQGIRELMVRVSGHQHVHAHLMTALHVLHLLHLQALHVLPVVLLHTLCRVVLPVAAVVPLCVCTLMARSCMTMHSARASLVTRVQGAEGVPERRFPVPPNRRLLILKEQGLIYGRLARNGGRLQVPVPGGGLMCLLSKTRGGWGNGDTTLESRPPFLKGDTRGNTLPSNLFHLGVAWTRRSTKSTAWITPGHACLSRTTIR